VFHIDNDLTQLSDKPVEIKWFVGDLRNNLRTREYN